MDLLLPENNASRETDRTRRVLSRPSVDYIGIGSGATLRWCFSNFRGFRHFEQSFAFFQVRADPSRKEIPGMDGVRRVLLGTSISHVEIEPGVNPGWGFSDFSLF